jgi:hypothetical protein
MREGAIALSHAPKLALNASLDRLVSTRGFLEAHQLCSLDSPTLQGVAVLSVQICNENIDVGGALEFWSHDGYSAALSYRLAYGSVKYRVSWLEQQG